MTQLSPPAAQKGAPASTKPRRRSSKSPTARALADLRDLGFTAAVVERWNPYAKVRHDLFGVIDIIAMFPDFGILGVQCTSRDNHAARRTKALAEPALRTWLECGGRFEVWSYAKQGARGERKTWQLKREELTLQMLEKGAG